MEKLPDLTQYFTPDIVALFAEVNQPRSNYQLEKFVLNQHDTPEQQFAQCVIEIQILYYTIKEVSLNIKKSEIKIERLRATGDEIDAIDADIEELHLEQTRVQSVGAYRELEYLFELLKKYPRYTRNQIEAGQADYWHKRMNRQFEIDKIGGTPNVAAHLNSLIQMGELQFELPEHNTEIENLAAKELES